MRRFSLRSLLGFSVLLLVILPCLIAAWLLVQRAPMAVEELASRALQEAARRGQAGSQAHLVSAYKALDGLMPENSTKVRSDQALAWVSDPALFAPMAFALTRSSSDLRFVYYGSQAGAIHGVENAVDGFRFSGGGAVDNGTRSFTQQLLNDPAKPRLAEGESTDPRGQPWYQAAVQAKGRVFSPVRLDPASKHLMVTLSQPVYDISQAMVGVLGADLSLQALTSMLRAIAVSPRGVAFLVDDKGKLLASSGDAPVAAAAAGPAELTSPSTSGNPLIRASYDGLKDLWVQASGGKVMRVKSVDTPIFAAYANVGESLGLKWRLVVAAPESDFSAATDLPLHFSLMALGCLMLAALLITAFGVRHLEHQLESLRGAINQIANSDAPTSGAPTRVLEFSQLSASLQSLGQQLNDSRIDALSESFSNSEGSVDSERSEQLEASSLASNLSPPAEAQAGQAMETLKAQLVDSVLELAAMRDRAMAATRSKAAFLAVISHELRTPLNGVVGMTNLLCHTTLSSEQQDYLQSLTLASQQLQEVVEEVLEFSRTESAELTLACAPFEVCQVVESACDRAIKAAHAKDLKFVIDIPDQVKKGEALVPWVINGDATRFAQILAHLAWNAVKFTATGSVTVRVRPSGKDSSCELPMLEVGVIDSGPGIATPQLRNVFLAFTQLDSSINRKYGGTGLGLATCKRLVELMGGHIGVESELGVGSTFWFTALAPWADTGASWASLPVMNHSDAVSPLNSVNRQPQKPKIMVVDDNPINLKVACAMLLKLGYPILTAEGGREAIDSVADAIATGEKIGAIFMDVHMPDVDGILATSSIRAAHGDLAPPIIALTTGSAVDYEQRCLDVGMVEYLSKPLKLTALAKSLEKWVTLEPVMLDQMLEEDQAPEDWIPDIAPDALPDALPDAAPDAAPDTAPEPIKPANFVRFSDADDAMPAGLVDFDRLNDFKEFDDSQLSMSREVISLVFSEIPILLSDIKLAILKDDSAGLIRAAHSLRGTASNVGAVTVQHLCSVLERDTLELQAVPPDANGCLVALRIAWNRTRPLIEKWR